jgi:hypothetical protein
MNPIKRTVSVVHEPTRKIVAEVTTVKEAEDWIAAHEAVDPEGVFRGDYSIDAPEGHQLKLKDHCPICQTTHTVAVPVRAFERHSWAGSTMAVGSGSEGSTYGAG